MATLSRLAFLNVLAIGGAFVLTGCGGSTDKNSNYTGSYRSAYSITSSAGDEVGTFDFTVDVKGNISGLMDNLVGKVREVSGRIDSEGTFVASTRDRSSDSTGQISGTMSIAPTTIPIGTDVIATPVIGGNFSLVEGTTTLPVNFAVNASVDESAFAASYGNPFDLFDPAVSFGGASQNTLIDSNAVDFSIDRQGRLLGTVAGYRVEGQVTKNNRVSGSVIDNDGKRYTFSGIATRLTYSYFLPPISGTGDPTSESDPGINFQVIWSINGKEYNGYIQALGGAPLTSGTPDPAASPAA